jgi:5-methyltetrahydropteroyltriglutamate--homocysteine methyltransferase
MKRSKDRILTSHVGSLPRTDRLIKLLGMKDKGQQVDQDNFRNAVLESTRNVLLRQFKAGIDIANNGEQSRVVNYYCVICASTSIM